MTKKATMTVLDASDQEYSGTPEEIVEQMFDLSFIAARDVDAWMYQVAQRAFTQTGIVVDPSSPESFIDGMMQAGLLKPKAPQAELLKPEED